MRVSVKMRHDLIVVGAGTAGCMAAKTAAEGGLGVLLIDSKPRDEIGDTACGNVVSAGDLDRVGIRHPKDICRVLKGVKVFSPDRKTVFTINLKHFVLDVAPSVRGYSATPSALVSNSPIEQRRSAQ